MYRDELIKTIAKTTGATGKSVSDTLDELLTVITKTLKKGGEVKLVGFGTFKTHKRKARTGRNPRTGQTIKIPAKTLPKFVAGSKLTASVK